MTSSILGAGPGQQHLPPRGGHVRQEERVHQPRVAVHRQHHLLTLDDVAPRRHSHPRAAALDGKHLVVLVQRRAARPREGLGELRRVGGEVVGLEHGGPETPVEGVVVVVLGGEPLTLQHPRTQAQVLVALPRPAEVVRADLLVLDLVFLRQLAHPAHVRVGHAPYLQGVVAAEPLGRLVVAVAHAEQYHSGVPAASARCRVVLLDDRRIPAGLRQQPGHVRADQPRANHHHVMADPLLSPRGLLPVRYGHAAIKISSGSCIRLAKRQVQDSILPLAVQAEFRQQSDVFNDLPYREARRDLDHSRHRQ